LSIIGVDAKRTLVSAHTVDNDQKPAAHNIHDSPAGASPSASEKSSKIVTALLEPKPTSPEASVSP